MTKISIIIATYNAEKFLQECLDSIIPQLNNQIELLIIDGGSQDKTMDIVYNNQKYINYYVSMPDEGIYDAWNKGVKIAKGEWVMFLGADDILISFSLISYLDYLNKGDYSNYDLVSSKCTIVDINGVEIRNFGSLWTWPRCIIGVQISHPGALHNKALFDEVGLFSLDYKISADFELLLRKGEKLKSSFMDKLTVRMREGGMSYSTKSIDEYYKIIKNCPKVNFLIAFILWINMRIRFFLKIQFRKIGINLHL